MDNNTKLHEFVTNAAVRNHITFGDVRRLQRDYLPAGVSTYEEAELLIQLDGRVGRADRAWTDWLVTAILDFAASNKRPTAEPEGDIRDRLKTLFASTGSSTKATRKIAREIRRDESRLDAERSLPQANEVKEVKQVKALAQPVSRHAQAVSPYAQPVSPYAVQRAINALPLAA